jgi:O-antigen ligase
MSHFQLVQLFTLFWFGSGMLRDPSFAKKAMLTMAIACVGLGVGSLIGVPGFSPEVDEGRATAFDFSPNTLASLMAYAAIIIIGFCLRETGWSAKRKLFLFALTIPLFLVLVSTGSRAGIGAFVIGMSFFFVPHRGSKKQKLAFVVALAAITAIVLLVMFDPRVSERWSQTIVEGESAGREYIYGAALDMFAERPIAGWGGRAALDELGLRLGLIGRHRAAHNLIFHLLIEVGLIGAVPFLIALGLCARAAWKGRVDRFGLIPLALIMALFFFNLTHTGIRQKVFWLFLGFAVAASSINQERRFRWVASRRPAGPSGEGLQPRVSASNSWPASPRESRLPTSFQSPNKKA